MRTKKGKSFYEKVPTFRHFILDRLYFMLASAIVPIELGVLFQKFG